MNGKTKQTHTTVKEEAQYLTLLCKINLSELNYRNNRAQKNDFGKMQRETETNGQSQQPYLAQRVRQELRTLV